MIVFGVINLICGIVMNTNEYIRVAAFFTLGTSRPGTFNLALGAVLLIGGIILVVCGAERDRQKKAEELMLLQMMSEPPVPAPVPAPAPAPAVPYTRFRLQCVAGAFAGKRFPIQGRLILGRDAQKCALVFPADTHGISGVHCQLEVLDGSVWIRDLGSTYGTFLEGGIRLAAGQAVRLAMGSRFWLGSEKEVFMITPKGGL
ncbi:MAG: FHA domain-containing protein [Clostridia bacterium]|nr:FHA domain-containing protein [Clostridia bacterium]